MKLKTQLWRAAVGECSPAAGFLGCMAWQGAGVFWLVIVAGIEKRQSNQPSLSYV